MHTRYYKEYSHNLQRDMEFKVYGHAGLPFIVFPCQDGKYIDFESRGMIDTVAHHIEAGRLTLCCIGCVDEETWSAKGGDHHGRIMWHEQYEKYVAVGLANIINVFQPQKICIGGGISKEGETLVAPIREYVERERYSKNAQKQTVIKAAELGNDAGIIGAAFLGNIYR